MAGTDGPQKADLQEVKRLTHLYAQSRVLPLIIPLFFIVLNAGLILGWFAFVDLMLSDRWPFEFDGSVLLTPTLVLLAAWCLASVWVTFKAIARYGPRFYRGEGQAVLRSRGIPIWAFVLCCVAYLGPAILNAFELLPIRWALTTALASFGVFVVYAGKREQEAPWGIVCGGLLLLIAIATAAGLPTPFRADSLHAFWLTWMIYIVGAGAIATIVVHLYNRRILRRLKGANPLGSQQ